MMKILLISALFITLNGCSDRRALDKAQQDFACKEFGGVYSYVKPFSNLTCNDATTFRLPTWRALMLPPEYYPNKQQSEE